MIGSGPFVSLPFPSVNSSVCACLFIFIMYLMFFNKYIKKRVENEMVSYKIFFHGSDVVFPSLIFVNFVLHELTVINIYLISIYQSI